MIHAPALLEPVSTVAEVLAGEDALDLEDADDVAAADDPGLFHLTTDPAHWHQWQPTAHRPGTPDKVEILRLRAGLGLPLFHSHDARKSEDLS